MSSVAAVRGLRIVRDDRTILDVEHLEIGAGERWALLGPNGSGKSTLLLVLAGRLWPTAGEVTLLGQRVGTVDLRQLRAHLGLLSATFTRQLRPGLLVRDAVVTGIDGALETWWRPYGPEERAAAAELLAELGVEHLAGSPIGVISEGERARVLLARVLIAKPSLLCLDEPAAGLDLGAREELLQRLGRLFDAVPLLPAVVVTHHLEELPASMTHAALLREGQVLGMGPIAQILTSELVSETFATEVVVTAYNDGRFSARST